MKSNDVLSVIVIIIIFILLNLFNFLTIQVVTIKKNWPLYRCNPLVMPFASVFGHDTQETLFKCMQTMQSSSMAKYLAPINHNVSVISKSQQATNKTVKNTYEFINQFRDSISTIVQKIFSVFVNLVVEFQKVLLNMKDVMSRLVAIFATFIYMFEASNDYIYPAIGDAYDVTIDLPNKL